MTINKLSEYGHSFQIKVIYSIITDKKFLQSIYDILMPEYFESEAHKWIIQYALDYFKKYSTVPTMEVLSIEVKKIKNEVHKIAVKEELRCCYVDKEKNAEDSDYVKEEFFNFCKNQALKEAIMQSAELLNNGAYEDIRRLIDNALKAGHSKDPGHDYAKDTETMFEDDAGKTITFPWKIFNTITDGGLGPGDLMLLFAPPGIGKTTVVANIAAHNIQQGKNILYFSLELSEKYMSRKIASILNGIDVKELKNNKDLIRLKASELPGTLKIKAYPPRRASLDTLEAHMNYLEISEGFIPDLVIIDYPEMLKVRKSRKEAREEVDDVYIDIKGIAVERQRPFISPSQINRAGAKDEIIEGDKVAGSFGKMMIGDLNVSLSRLRKDKLNNTGRFHIIKSRLGPDGMTYPALIDLNKGFISISEEEYDEESSDNSVKVNGHEVSSEIVKHLADKFKKFSEVTEDLAPGLYAVE